MDCSVSLLWVSWLWAVCTIISPIVFLISGSKAYRRVSQNRWRTLGNVHSPSYRMIWRRAGWRPPVPVWSCSVKLPAQSEDQPIGWFELEEDWNDVEIKLQQCRIAKVRTRAHTHTPYWSLLRDSLSPPRAQNWEGFTGFISRQTGIWRHSWPRMNSFCLHSRHSLNGPVVATPDCI